MKIDIDQLSKAELLQLYRNSGWFLRITQGDINRARADCLFQKAEKMSTEALAVMERVAGKGERAMFDAAGKKFNRAMKMSDRALALLESSRAK